MVVPYHFIEFSLIIFFAKVFCQIRQSFPPSYPIFFYAIGVRYALPYRGSDKVERLCSEFIMSRYWMLLSSAKYSYWIFSFFLIESLVESVIGSDPNFSRPTPFLATLWLFFALVRPCWALTTLWQVLVGIWDLMGIGELYWHFKSRTWSVFVILDRFWGPKLLWNSAKRSNLPS